MTRYQLVRLSDHTYEIVLRDAPQNAVALQMAPDRMEERLRSGVWLVVLCAVWSGPDVKAIGQALQLAAQLPSLNVGIRPFDDFDELTSWLPEASGTTGSPIWLVLHDGNLIDALVGLVDDRDLKERVERVSRGR